MVLKHAMSRTAASVCIGCEHTQTLRISIVTYITHTCNYTPAAICLPSRPTRSFVFEKVRIVYFDEALTADNTDFTTKLGVGNYNAGALSDIQTIKLTGNVCTSENYVEDVIRAKQEL